MRSKWLLAGIGLLIAVLAIGAIACGDDDEISQDDIDEQEDPGVLRLTASLTEVDGSGASGEANLSINGEGILVQLDMEGLTEGAHANHIHDGSCDNLGAVDIPLDDIVADSAGAGSQTTGNQDEPLSHFETGHLVAVHADDGAIVACGDVVSA